MDLTLDRSSRIPLYRQIVDQIRDGILAGTLPAGFRLPPERRLARALGVNRTTVLNAYRELKAEALVDAHVGRGTIVQSPDRAPASATIGEEMPWQQLLRVQGPEARDPILRDLLELSERPDVISLAVGLPAPELIPVDTFRPLIDRLMDEVGPDLFQHCPTEGLTRLRESLSVWLATRGIVAAPGDVLMLSGSQQGLDLVARVLLEPGDTVIVEEPSYIGALQVFRAARARVVPVPMDEDGMRTDLLAATLERHRPKLVYTLPTFQNPSGAVMSLERRHHLLELAEQFGVPVLEDDPYWEIRFSGELPPSLKALDPDGRVIHLGTFSKILFPGLRLGFMVAPRTLLRPVALAKQSADLHASSLAQWLLDAFLRGDHMTAHGERLRREYRRRRDVVHDALDQAAVEGLSWRLPRGGFYLWCRLPAGAGGTRLVQAAAAAGVAFLPGRACFSHETADEFVRLSYSFAPPARLRDGAGRLAEAIRDAARGAGAIPSEAFGTSPVV
jgi:DNA-binding transcriptional MocR family regulator